MKVLFVGEGTHDIGRPQFAPQVRSAHGVVPALAKKVCAGIGEDSVAIFWREIPVLNEKKRKRGLAAKVESALLLAMREHCDGTVCVYDNDRDDQRMASMEDGAARAAAIFTTPHAVVCGVAVESIEAWTLAAPDAIAAAHGVALQQIQQLYKLRDVESLYQKSGKPEHRPKDILGQVAALAHREDSSDFREMVAHQTDIDSLKDACPKGFKPFAEKLVAAFGSR
jgi:hypothetical protein